VSGPENPLTAQVSSTCHDVCVLLIQKQHSHDKPVNGDVKMKVDERHEQANVEGRQQQASNKSRPASDAAVAGQPAMAAAPAADVGNVVLESVHKDQQRNVVMPADMNKHDLADDVQRRNSVNQDTQRVGNNSVLQRDVKRVDSAL